MKSEETKIGKHYWVISSGYLLVVLRVHKGFEVCGPWECGMTFDDIDEVISEIEPPMGYEDIPQYYVDYKM